MRQAVGGIAVVVDDEDAHAARARVARRAAAPGAARCAGVSGRRTVNSLPLPRPSLCGVDRAAVHLGQPAHEREADAEAALVAPGAALAAR